MKIPGKTRKNWKAKLPKLFPFEGKENQNMKEMKNITEKRKNITEKRKRKGEEQREISRKENSNDTFVGKSMQEKNSHWTNEKIESDTN